MKRLPDIDILQELFSYEPDTGLVYWKKSNTRRVKVGSIAGNTSDTGYRCVGINNTSYKLHRVIWKLQTGEDPIGMEVDHIDRNPLNNRWENLRLVDKQTNMLNTGMRSHNTTGYTGVVKEGRGYKAQVGYRGKVLYLGHYKTPEEASKVYLQKKKELQK